MAFSTQNMNRHKSLAILLLQLPTLRYFYSGLIDIDGRSNHHLSAGGFDPFLYPLSCAFCVLPFLAEINLNSAFLQFFLEKLTLAYS